MASELDELGEKRYIDFSRWVHGKGRSMPTLQYRKALRDQRSTPAGIPHSMSEANAGVSGSSGEQHRARKRVAEWPFAGSQLSPAAIRRQVIAQAL